MAARKAKTEKKSSTLLDEVERSAESLAQHVSDLVGQLTGQVAETAQALASRTSSVGESVRGAESSARQAVLALVSEVEAAGQELAHRAGELFDNLKGKVVTVEQTLMKKSKPKKKATKKKATKKKATKKKATKKAGKVVKKRSKRTARSSKTR